MNTLGAGASRPYLRTAFAGRATTLGADFETSGARGWRNGTMKPTGRARELLAIESGAAIRKDRWNPGNTGGDNEAPAAGQRPPLTPTRRSEPMRSGMPNPSPLHLWTYDQRCPRSQSVSAPGVAGFRWR